MWSAASQNPLSEALHLLWKPRQLLWIKVNYVKVGCFILTDVISNKKISDSLILENKVPLSEKAVHTGRELLWQVTAAAYPWEKYFFLLTAAGFICVWCRARQIYIFLVWANFYFVTSMTTQNTHRPAFWLVTFRAVSKLDYKYKVMCPHQGLAVVSDVVGAQKYFLGLIWLSRNSNISTSSMRAHQAQAKLRLGDIKWQARKLFNNRKTAHLQNWRQAILPKLEETFNRISTGIHSAKLYR